MNSPKDIDTKGLRQFGLTTGTIAVVLFGLLLPWLFGHGYPLWPWALGGVLAISALVWPIGLRPIYIGWMTVGHALGQFNSRVILALMFYLMITPIGLLRRLLGKDAMAREFDAGASSYRVESPSPAPNHLERPF
ncbi:MAG: sxtJ [Gammaproteobacteria bacterium]|nr:sxtJ [Gammaproteobacteria bacterium]NNJ84951.1 sxtJ [Gammaproteobacteria bacterium]